MSVWSAFVVAVKTVGLRFSCCCPRQAFGSGINVIHSLAGLGKREENTCDSDLADVLAQPRVTGSALSS